MKKMMIVMAMVLGLLVFFTHSVSLAETKLKITWGQGVSTDFDAGAPNIERGVWSTNHEMSSCTIILRPNGNDLKAFLTGNQGATELLVVKDEAGLTFVEYTPSGLSIITILTKRTNTKRRKLWAVMSRHFILLNKEFVSQYYGTVKVYTE